MGAGAIGTIYGYVLARSVVLVSCRLGAHWEQVVYGEKPMIRQFLKENPVYEKATNNDRVAVRTVCNDARAMVGKKK